MRSILSGWLFIALGVIACSSTLRAHAQMPDHGMHPPMPDQQYYIRMHLDREGEPVLVEELVNLPSPSAPAALDQVVTLPTPLSPIRLTQYLPQATLTQTVVAEDGPQGKPAIELSIDGPTQSYQRWLVAGDMERNRLTSFIANWRYMSVVDSKQRKELYTQFENELTRDAKLLVSARNGTRSHELAVKPGATHTLEDLDCRIGIKSFYPHFAMDRDTKEPTNRSDKKLNPAALVEIEYKGEKEERWVFAKFPDYSQSKERTLPFKVTLDSPVELQRDLPDFVVVTMDRSKHEVWARYEGAVTSKEFSAGERISVGKTQYNFHIARFVASGQLVEDYRPAEGRGGVPALQFKTMDESGKELARWLPAGGQQVIATTIGPMTISFGPRQAAPHGEKP